MKARYQHLEGISSGINCFWVKNDQFDFFWHYHPEIEITYVHQGRGTRLVGDNVSAFGQDDFVFMGSNLPHTWITDDDFNRSSKQIEVIVLQFAPSLFDGDWLALPEMSNIKYLLRNAVRGINVNPSHKPKAIKYLHLLLEAEGFEKVIIFLQLLNYLGEEPDFDLLASISFVPALNEATENRLLKVCQHVHKEFTRPIKLEEMASLANMNPTSFCRFFKKATGQPFMEYVNDLRIGKASNLLLESRDLNITEIAYASGFNSQTLFNRIFLRKKNMTPSAFRKIGRG